MRAAITRSARLGTFAGVFTPSVLTILGLILFRRLGYVVGAAGLLQALVILALAHTISILTSTSLSAIATNLKVRGGGDYYLISRSLGVEFGGALGIVLFLAQSISVAFYLLGFGEALSAFFPAALHSTTAVALAATVFLFVFAWLGADWATRLQYFVMAALAAALFAFFAGAGAAFSPATLSVNWGVAPDAPGFWTLFALFFPAVTGFTQGVSMSGDLENPGRSLPLGTFAAVGVSLVVYTAAAVLFAGALPRETLTADYDAMAKVSIPALITLGIAAATLSSALASFLGAPRILQALAADRIFPLLAPFAAGHGRANNPRRGVLATLAIALVFAALGGVDFIAPIVSMFFLISYGLLNYATAFEAKAASPSFRPRFRWFHYRASLAGALLCLGTMVMISPLASAIAMVVLFALYQYVDRLSPPDRWADSRRDHYFQTVRQNLLAMAREGAHPRNWRPHLLVFSNTPSRRELLVRFAGWLEGGVGVATVVRVLEGTDAMSEEAQAARKELAADIAERGIEAFSLVIAAPDFDHSVNTLIQAYGIGPLRANTILLNWLEQRPGDAEEREASQRLFVMYLRAADRLGVNVIVLDAKEQEWQVIEPLPSERRRIDVWWSDDATSRLMLLLAYLMTRSEAWQGATVRLICRAKGGAVERSRERLRATLEEYRIEAEAEIVERLTPAGFVELARDASLVFVPLRLARQRAVDPFGRPVAELLERLAVAALVSAAEDIDLDAAPEEGEAGRMAALQDAAADTERAAQAAAKEAARACEGEREAHEALDAIRKEVESWVAAEMDAREREAAGAKLAAAEERAASLGSERMKAEDALARARAAAERAARALETAGEPASSPALTKSEQKKAHA
jgi:amino acid transporter